MPDSRIQQFRGRSPPDRPDWQVSTVSLRGTNRSETTTCPVTESTVALDDSHYYVTLVRETRSPIRPDDYDHFVVADVGVSGTRGRFYI